MCGQQESEHSTEEKNTENTFWYLYILESFEGDENVICL